ncbi:MAG: cation:proton antiporter [Bacteroidaceae bacterium]|nr:cation:proton antiporter [Bacteroidaceae bacterium]
MMQLLLSTYTSTALVTDPTWIFSVVLCIILLAPLLLRSLRIPHVIGLILAGVFVGKYGLNVLDRDSSFELFGQVGIYYIMFLAGLELDMGSVQHYGRDGIKFGLLTFLIPFFLGFLASHYLLGFSVLTSILMACIYSSHTLVTYPTVGRYGLSRHRIVVKSVVATAFALFVSLLVLAFIIGSLKPDTTLLTWMLFAAKCCVYVAAVLFIFPRLGRWFLRRYGDSVMQYIFILALVFLSASFAKLVGLEGLLGAFLAGLVVNRLIPKTSPLMSRLEFVGNAIFIPYFLIGVGMLIDVRIMLGDPQTLWIILIMVVTGTLSKLLAAAAMAWWSGEDRNSMWLMFGLTNAHAAGALAIVMIGTDPAVNLMSDQVLNGTVMLILFSCVLSGFATSRGAKRLALSDTTLEDNRGSYHGKCLITYSQHDNVDVMTQLAILIRNPYIPDSLMGLCVSYDTQDDGGVGNYRLGKQMLERAQEIAASADVPMATLNRMSTNIAGGILRTMKEYDCGEVVMCLADRTTGMPKSSLGPIIDDIVGGSHREVMIVRSIVPPGTIRRVLVAVPQKAEYEVGFYKWLEHICRIGEQLDCHIEFHAHTDTLPYIQGYMQQKHGNVRTQCVEMNLWTQVLSLQHQTTANDMLVAVTARPGFISYQPQFDSLPIQIHRYFGHTSVMLLYPDQWGDPLDTVSVFTPNGTAVTRQQRSLGSLIRRLFFTQKTPVLMLAALFALPCVAQKADYSKMSSYIRRAVIQQKAERRKAPSVHQQAPLMSAIVHSSSRQVLQQYGCKIQAQWGDIYIVTLRANRIAALSQEPQVHRIEAGEPCVAYMDTSRIITHIDAIHSGRLAQTPWTGRGVVMGIMDIGFDLTHPTFFSADAKDYRIRSFWDQLDFSGKGDNRDSMYIGCEYTTSRTILRKAYAADGQQQFHGTHTAGTAAGSGYNSPYVGAAPEADICLVANAVSSDRSLVPDTLWYLYNTASDLLGFKYIFDYADRHHQPCVISFSEGRKQELYGEDMLAFQILDSMLTPGHILCSSAGNDGLNLTYLHKPVGKASASAMMVLSSGTTKQAFYNLRASACHRFQLHFYATPGNRKGMVEYSTEQVFSCPDSMLIDTLSVGVKQYMVCLASYPSCYNSEQVVTELYVRDVTQTSGPNYRIGLILLGEEVEAEAITYSGFFENPTNYPDFSDAETSHSINFPACSPNIICVGSTAYRTGVHNYSGDWVTMDYGSGGMRGSNTSIGPSLAGLVKPDVMAPGQNIIASFSSYYSEAHPNADQRERDVERFQFQGREYSWSAQSGTSMASPIVGGIIACWMQAFPRLSYQQAMEAIAATSRQPDPELSYPNNYYGYGEIDAEAGLRYLFNVYGGIEDGIDEMKNERVKSEKYDNAVYDLSGRRLDSSLFTLQSSHKKKGIYIVNGHKVLY